MYSGEAAPPRVFTRNESATRSRASRAIPVSDDEFAYFGVGNVDAPLPAALADDRDDTGRQVDIVIS